MEYKDYYDILGVGKKASSDEIKRAYRTLALKYHPDRNQGDEQAEEKFKEINEAYQVLSDPSKRSRYDQLGSAYSSWQRTGAPGGFNWDEWFTTAPGGGVRVEFNDFGDLFGGGFSDFFTRIFGGFAGMDPSQVRTGRGRRKGQTPQSPRYQQKVIISLQESYSGSSRRISIDGRQIEVKIPRGARTGTKVRVAGVGPAGPDRVRSDLYLLIEVAPDPRFKRTGNNLKTDIEVDLYTAVLGGELPVATLSGDVLLNIPPGTQPGQTFRLSGKGMPYLRSIAKFGDLFVKAKVRIPKQLSSEEMRLFKELAKITKK